MRSKLAAAVGLVACGLVATAQDAPPAKYISKDGGFAVLFPAAAEVKTSTKDVPGGLTTYIAAAIDKAERRTYVVSYTPHAKGVLKSQAKSVLDLGEKVTLTVPNTAKVAVKDFTFGKQKFPVREIVSLRDGNQTRTRFVLADPTLYVLVVGGPTDFATGKDATDFLDSFEIVPAGKAKKE